MTLEEFVNFVVNSPYETVANELERNYRTPMVSDIRTIEQKQDATQKMAYAVSVYAFLSPVRARVNYKKSVCDKKSAEYAVLIRKVELLDAYIEIAKVVRDSISRMFSCSAQVLEQIRVEGSIV